MSVLGYWNIHGLAEPIRFLLEYVGEKYEDLTYELGEPPEYLTEAWLSVKFKLGLDFPNLPYYNDGKRNLSQSNAILRYISRKYKLDGTSEDEKVRIDLINEEIKDVLMPFERLVYEDKERFNENKVEYLKNFKTRLANYEKFLGKNPFFAGDKITFVDFVMYEQLDIHRRMEPKVLDDFPQLKGFLDRIEALPNIKTYLASDRYKKRSVNGKMANC